MHVEAGDQRGFHIKQHRAVDAKPRGQGTRGGPRRGRIRSGCVALRVFMDVTLAVRASALVVAAGLPGQLGNPVQRNEVAELARDGGFTPRWLLTSGWSFQPPVPCRTETRRGQHFFYRSSLISCGVVVDLESQIAGFEPLKQT